MAAKNAAQKRKCRTKQIVDKEQGWAIARRIKKQAPMATVNCYKCRYCGKYHVGNRKMNEKMMLIQVRPRRKI